MEEKKVINFIKNTAIDIVVALLSVAYVLYSMVEIHSSNLSFAECTLKSLLAIVVGLMVKQMLGENGFTKGYNDEKWSTELFKYNNVCNSANDYMERVDNFYYCEEIEKRKQYRKRLLMGARLKYDMFFDEKENYKEDSDLSKLTKHQKKILKKAVKVKVYNLNLFSEYENDTTANIKKETNDKDQRMKNFSQNIFGHIVTAVVGVYFIVELNQWNWANFFSAIFQVFMWIAFGVVQLYTNYNYVVVEKVNKLKRKKELIQKFVSGCAKGMYLTNPYDEYPYVDKKVEENIEIIKQEGE